MRRSSAQTLLGGGGRLQISLASSHCPVASHPLWEGRPSSAYFSNVRGTHQPCDQATNRIPASPTGLGRDLALSPEQGFPELFH